MSINFETWRKHAYPVPTTMKAWTLNGAGFDALGVDGKPIECGVPRPGPGELLLRVDAVGICFSDVKLTRAGDDHPRIRAEGRKLADDPTRPGHEAALTVAAVGQGQGLEDQYQIGDRFTIQADVFYQGKSMAFGYVIPGAYSEYVLVGEEVLAGDEGCYLLPIPPRMGYVEAALCEPWACVEASYRQFARERPAPAGRMLIVTIDAPQNETARWDMTGVVPQDSRVVEITAPSGTVPADMSEHGAFDDVVLLGCPAPELVEQALAQLDVGGVLCIASEKPVNGRAAVDVGRIHYELLRLVGTSQPRVATAYEVNNRTELKAGGAALFIGAAGPMGQMHVQRALELSAPPRLIVASDPSRPRMSYAMNRWQPLAKRRGVELVAFDPASFTDGAALLAALRERTAGAGYDDIVVLVPLPQAIEQTSDLIAPGGVVNIFAGVPVGTVAKLAVSDVILKDVRFLGTSGSKLSDMRKVVEKATRNELDTQRSLGAIGGLAQARRGVEGVAAGRFNGKTVLFPGIPDLELTAVEDVANDGVAGLLDEGGIWTTAAERRLLEESSELRA